MNSKNLSRDVAQSVLDHLHEGCQVIDFEYRYLYVNPTVAAQGKSTVAALIGKKMTECYPGIDDTPMFEMLKKCMHNRAAHQMENEFRYPNGTRGWFELKFLPVPEGVCILSQDITLRKSLELQVHQLQKMEAVSRLAGGMAHDFNNVISVIGMHAEALAKIFNGQKEPSELLSQISNAVQKSTRLTRQLLTFSRKKLQDLKVVDVNPILLDFQKMLATLVGSGIQIRLNLEKKVDAVQIDVGQLEQVIMNLAVNARDAMPKGGTLTLETENVELDANYASHHLGVKPGHYVRIGVIDTGIGMSAETQTRIFEPFFSTKDASKGTGLGLSTVYGIVKQHQGTVWVQSEEGHGTKFNIYLPRSLDKPITNPKAVMMPNLEAETALRGTETILLVDDNEALRSIIKEILTEAGYKVHAAINGENAIQTAKGMKVPAHLLITDVVMPNMSGPELAKRVQTDWPNTKVLYLSGHVAESLEDSTTFPPGTQFLEKPFSTTVLKKKIRQILTD